MFRFVPVSLFAISVLLVFAAPRALDASYPPLSASISESAGQLVDGSWLARFALAFSGLGVLATAHLRHRAWPAVTTFAYVAFGVCWILTAAFSARSWQPEAPYVAIEDQLHSFFASAMAIVIVGAATRALTTLRRDPITAALAAALAVGATFLPLAGLVYPEVAGLLQRSMFLLAYVYFSREALISGQVPRGSMTDTR